MREIIVISGKGGTGKTSLCAAFAALSHNALLCDLDVDVPDLHIVLQPQPRQHTAFMGANKAQIGTDCIACGQCKELCQFDAIDEKEEEGFVVNTLACEGCGVCVKLCPQNAISFPEQRCGEWYISDTRFGPLVHAQLLPGQENSGKLVSLLKQEARQLAKAEGKELILCDGSPGIGCPVISSLSGANLAVCVAEPTLSGVADCQRVAGVCKQFRIPMGLVINKADINPEQTAALEAFCRQEGHSLFGKIPFDASIASAAAKARAVTETDSPLCPAIQAAWDKISHFTPRLQSLTTL